MKWALKIATKVVLSRLPVRYGLWRRLGLFRHGRMDRIDYALKIFLLHVQRAFPAGLPRGASVLELGPGDSIASALIAAGHGAGQIWLVDAGDFASKDVTLYKALAEHLKRLGIAVPDLSACVHFEDVLTACRARYLIGGLASFEQIADRSVDLIWSHSVLEHIRKAELEDMLAAMYRVLRPGGQASHNVDYQDHLDHALNNLRFPHWLWESPLLARSGIYTNRVPALVMHQMFRQVGFDLMEENFGRWQALPTPRRAMASEFNAYTDEDLLQRTSHALLRRPA